MNRIFSTKHSQTFKFLLTITSNILSESIPAKANLFIYSELCSSQTEVSKHFSIRTKLAEICTFTSRKR